MKTSVTKGLTDQKLLEVRQEFIASAALRAQLVKILNEKIEASRERTLSESSYEQASWAYRQADSNGYERAMKELISLLS